MTCRNVCITSDYDSGPEFYSETIQRAAKDHLCCECGERITRGERYHFVSGKWDGAFGYYRTCLPCKEIRETFGCLGWTFQMIWEDIREQIFPEWRRNELMIVDCLARLKTEAATAKARSMYIEYLKDVES